MYPLQKTDDQQADELRVHYALCGIEELLAYDVRHSVLPDHVIVKLTEAQDSLRSWFADEIAVRAGLIDRNAKF